MFQIYIFTKSAIITEMELSVSLYYKMYQQNKNSKRISDNKTHRRKLIFMQCVSVLFDSYFRACLKNRGQIYHFNKIAIVSR